MNTPNYGANPETLPPGQAPRARAAIYGRNPLPFHQTPAFGATHDLLVMNPHPQMQPRPAPERQDCEGGGP
ncbi:MAG TPA: hypothetical protein VHC86_06005 [Opitutaceae bacterium]|nr:hypothetical protein [Opitutaceae bacterium]